MLKLKNPIIVALDVDDDSEALRLGKELGPETGALKVGPRLTNRYGAKLVRELSQWAPIFLDHKYYDIPSTMEGAIRSGFDMGASLITVHASSGSTALSLMARIEKELNQQRPFQILAVTVLTSFKPEEQPSFYSAPIQDQVVQLAKLASQSGLRGFVCSPHEIQKIREVLPGVTLVTPGVRSGEAIEGEDQARVMKVAQAMKLGSDYLVIGRPILQASDPRAALRMFVQEATA
ncbi:MAG: orotidine-5'-phosphate decarboxylase [Bdellovibrionales bacterium]